MNEDYLLNTIKTILSTHKNGLGYVHFNELRSTIMDDMKIALNELVTEGKIRFQRDVNGNPIFFVNGEVD